MTTASAPLDADQLRTWRSVMRMHSRLVAVLAQELRVDSDMSLSDFEVLAILSEAPRGALRARDLRCELHWEKSRLAHHIGRMEQRGLVRRDTCTEDLRAPIVCITGAGRAAIRAAVPPHLAHVRELFFDALTAGQLRAVEGAADAVLRRIGQHCDAETDGWSRSA